MSELRKLNDARNKAIAAFRAIQDKAAEEGRELNAEEEVSWQEANADCDALDVRMQRVIELEERSAAADKAMALYGDDPEPEDSEPKPPSIEAELRKLAAGEIRSVDVMPERRDLTTSADSSIVPTSFYDQLVEHLVEASGVMTAGATVLNTASGEAMTVPVTTAHSSGSLISEGNAITESDPTFAARTLNAYKYAALIQVSSELVADTGVDLLGYLSNEAGRAVGLAAGAHFATGTGSSQPNGIVTASTLGATGDTGESGAASADNLIELFYSVIGPYRMNGAWLMDDTTIGNVRKLADTTGQYLWQPGLALDRPDSLLGKPVFSDPSIAVEAIDAKSIIFGDISRYFVRLAGGVRFERSDDYAFNTDLVSFRAILRADGELADQTGAVKHFVGGAS